ncbi:MAG: hypothetical protein M3O36_04000 [Myxococcota bacterium]|nr:hypothetical protein [Myxococcota bacterium]
MATKKKAKKKVSPKVAPAAKTPRAGGRPAKKKRTAAAPKSAKGKAPSRKATSEKATGRKALPAKKAGRRPVATATPPRRSSSQPKAAKQSTKRPAKREAPPSNTPRPASRVRRRDRPGHLDPQYAKELLEKSGDSPDGGRAFVERRRGLQDDLAEQLGEDAVAKATTGGEDVSEEALDQVVPEEVGGPFVESTPDQEFAVGTDPSNPPDAEPEPFPTT